jgi:2,3-bisphosphoglycerate-independent phosphoglycerate mutase
LRKRVLLVPDGMADEPQAELGGLTPLEAAETPCMDSLARGGIVGLVRTIPPGMAPGSDIGNLSVLGYDAASVYCGRSPLEAVNVVDLAPDDVSYRCNLVTVARGLLTDNTAGHPSNAEAHACFAALREALDDGHFRFHAGVTYRGLMVWRRGELVPCTPPHDILDQPVAGYLPGVAAGVADTPAAVMLRDLQRRADEVLARVRPATNAWFWGEGRRPHMPRFRDLYGLRGAVVGAVDLVRGIGRLAGLDVIDVPGATGDLDTDYGAKARAAIAALEDHDLVWVHVEAPDEAAHMGDLNEKIRAIERVDAEVLAPLLRALQRPAVMVLPDHYTPLSTRTHDGRPVPFVIGAPPHGGAGASVFGESAAAATGLAVPDGPELMRLFLAATGYETARPPVAP